MAHITRAGATISSWQLAAAKGADIRRSVLKGVRDPETLLFFPGEGLILHTTRTGLTVFLMQIIS